MNGPLTIGILIFIAAGAVLLHNGIAVCRNWLAEKLHWSALATHSGIVVPAATPLPVPPPATGPKQVTTITVPPGFILDPKDNVLLQPITPAAAWNLAQTASIPMQGSGILHGLNWNQLEYLRRMTPKLFGDWCFLVSQLPGVKAPDGGASQGWGWITGLTFNGYGYFASLAMPPALLVIPNTDPR